MNTVPSVVTATDLRKMLGGVAIYKLSPGSDARKTADQATADANDPQSRRDSVLHGEPEFQAAHRLLQTLGGGAEPTQARLRDNKSSLTAAGRVFDAWRQAGFSRGDLFDGIGVKGDPRMLYINIDGLDLSDLWKTDDHGDPRPCFGSTASRVSLFKVPPQLQRFKSPTNDDGVLLGAEGKDSVSLRRRGNRSVNDPKPQLSLFVQKDKPAGIPKQIKLVNLIRDPSYQRLHIAWSLLANARVPVQPHSFAELTIDQKYYGTYVAMGPLDRDHFETVWKSAKGVEDAAIFKANFGDLGPGNLRFRPGDETGSQYFSAKRPSERTYEPELDTPDSDYRYLAQFIKILNAVDLRDRNNNPITGLTRFNTPEFRQAMENIMDVYTFLRAVAILNLIGSWDTYYMNPANYYLHIEKRPAANGGIAPFVRFHPYDLDNTFGTSWPRQSRNWHQRSIFFGKAGGHAPDPDVGDIRLIEVVLRNDSFRNYYVDFMNWMVQNHFVPEKILHTQTQLWDDVLQHCVYSESDTEFGASITNRPWSNRQVFEAGKLNWEQWGFGGGFKAEGIIHFVEMRRDNVLLQLKALPLGQSGVDFDSDDLVPNSN
jgi:hypothetical protein